MIDLKLVFSEQFKSDFQKVADFNKAYSQDFAAKTSKTIMKNIKIIESNPLIGKELLKQPDFSDRKLIVEGYNVIYRICNNKILLLRVYNQKTNYTYK